MVLDGMGCIKFRKVTPHHSEHREAVRTHTSTKRMLPEYWLCVKFVMPHIVVVGGEDPNKYKKVIDIILPTHSISYTS